MVRMRLYENRVCFKINRLSILLLISMQSIVDFVSSDISGYPIDSFIIQNVQGCLGKEMKVDGWISLISFDRECVVLKFNNGVFMDQGFVVNDEKVLKVLGNHQIGRISYNEEEQSKIGIPFGYGEMYDDDGLLLYKGIMINWQRFGYGTSYHDNGLKEYEGYWCDDNRFGSGKVYDRYGKMVYGSNWCNGIESDIEYEGDGSEPLNIRMKHLKLTDNCVLVDWDVSLLYNLESIEIGDECFGSVKTFRIDGLNQLKTIKIGNNSFTQKRYWYGNDKSKSFHILNCESLESIQIGEYSFSDFGGECELKNLPQLQSIQIGTIERYSYNFFDSSFVLRGIDMILNTVMIRSS